MTATCPLCDSTELTTLFELTAAQAAGTFVSERFDADRHGQLEASITALWQQDKARVAECRSCSFGFADPYVAGDATYYQLAFGASGYPVDKWEFTETLGALDTGAGAGGRALEIGAGYGHFLDKIVPRFFKAQDVTAAEYNEAARNMLAKAGYRVVAKSAEEVAEEGDRYSAIFMFQILEHLDRSHAVFDALAKLAVSGGSVFISVPNPAALRFNEQHGSLLDTPPNHIGRWQPANFRAMADRHGFTVADVKCTPFSLGAFVRQDMVYSFLRRGQRKQGVASYLYARRHTRLGRVAAACGIAATAPLRLPAWAAAARNRQELGGSYWVHLVRN